MDERDNFGQEMPDSSQKPSMPEQGASADNSPNNIRYSERSQQQTPYGQPNGSRQTMNNGFPPPQNNGYNGQQYNSGQNGYGQQNSYGYDQPRRPVYDKFMYEPIGFEDPYGQRNITDDLSTKKRRPKGESAALILFVILIVVSTVVGVFGIVHDIVKSDDLIDKIGSPRQVVLYKEKKPEGANNEENYKDENGKYSPEGVAALVRPSIVKIYTYSDYASYTARKVMGTGSGVVLNEDGYIVTNAHVLEAKGYHKVETVDGDFYDAKIVGRDAKTDIAVIKIDAEGLSPATLGDSDEAVVGEQVIAIGNPANLSSTVTDGIISAVNRKIRSDSTGFEMDCLQTNADISPGNSGGALVNMYGQVIGITSSKYVSAEFEGLGFAITINEASPVIEQLIKNGYISGRFRIGIHLLDMENEAKIEKIEKAIGQKLPEDFKGIYIDAIDRDCDIANTDLKKGDFITAINGKSVSTYDELYDTISSQYGAGDTVPATCAHIGKDGEVSYYEIQFRLMEDTSGNY